MLRGRSATGQRWVVPIAAVVVFGGCSSMRKQSADTEPKIEFTKVPKASVGGPVQLGQIEGRVTGARRGQRIVLFTKTNVWYIQPYSSAPFTTIDSNSNWKSDTHFGIEYAALLVDPSFTPPTQTKTLPSKGGPVAAIARVRGTGFERVAQSVEPRNLRFSGFDWQVRSEPSDRGGLSSQYEPANASIDPQGRLHLKITRNGNGWKCAEIRLLDSLGYGTYTFTVENTGHLEPAAVIGFYTFDEGAPRQNYREMNIELSRWGDPLNKSAQYAVQPFYIPANVVRFSAPNGKVSHSLRWSPGRADFRSVATDARSGTAIADYSFTSGVPSPGEETVFISLYAYGVARSPLTRETEVIVDRFEYKP
jgi:hypothetical protein